MPVVLRVFEPAPCCPPGACATPADPAAARFEEDVAWLASQGIAVERHRGEVDAAALADAPALREALARGAGVLPLVAVGASVAVEGAYPSRETLAALAGVPLRRRAGRALAQAPCCAPSASAPAGSDGSSGCC